MKKVIALFLLATPVFASGPKYTGANTDPQVNQEFINAYQDIRNPVINYAQISSETVKVSSITQLSLGGNASANGFKITGLANGTAATDAVAFGQIVTSSITYTTWASYTPSIAGCGTVSAVSFFWKQIGDTIFVKGFWTAGSVSGSGVTISLPNSTVINTAKVAANFYLGKFDRLPTGASGAIGNGSVFTDGTVGNDNVVFCTQGSGANKFTAQGGSTIFLNGDSAAVFFDYPI